jgi:hypothetical protein
MAALYTAAGALITERVTSVIPDYEISEVENKLLDNSIHTQIIGTPARICKISLVVTSVSAKNSIDTYKSLKTPVKVTADGNYYMGIIRGSPEWDRLAPGVYQTNLTLIVSEEGTV